MNIFVYSDESGVFDAVHNEYFVFGGVVFLSKDERDIASRKFISAEDVIRRKEGFKANDEIKGNLISGDSKAKLLRSLNGYHKFAVIIDQKRVLPRIYQSKRDKQRYLDYAYKIGVKRLFQNLIQNGVINPKDVENLHFYIDEHTTATNGRYELKEGLEQEFRFGTYNYNYDAHFPPLFSNLKQVDVQYCNSKNKTLIRAADIVSNVVLYKAITEQPIGKSNLVVTYLP